MKKLLLLVGITLICSSCTGVKKINGEDDTFFNFVIMNTKNREKRTQELIWDNMNNDCFPGLRIAKWYKAEKIK